MSDQPDWFKAYGRALPRQLIAMTIFLFVAVAILLLSTLWRPLIFLIIPAMFILFVYGAYALALALNSLDE